jgi:hypothetical protein
MMERNGGERNKWSEMVEREKRTLRRVKIWGDVKEEGQKIK